VVIVGLVCGMWGMGIEEVEKMRRFIRDF